MHRRSLFGVIAGAVPLLWMRPVKALEVLPEAKYVGAVGCPRCTLSQVRDLLLPGLWGFKRDYPHIQTDIYADQETKNLLVVAYKPETRAFLGYAITEQRLIDGLYKAEFAPSVTALLRCVDEFKLSDAERYSLGAEYTPPDDAELRKYGIRA